MTDFYIFFLLFSFFTLLYYYNTNHDKKQIIKQKTASKRMPFQRIDVNSRTPR